MSTVTVGGGTLQAGHDLRVCVLGDSFVAGVGDPDHLGWAGRVAARTHRAGHPLTLYTLGVRRQTSRDIADRWRAECVPRLPDGCDGRILVAGSVNDTTVEHGAFRVPTVDSVAHLQEVLRGARDAGWPALVVGPPPVSDRGQNERTSRLDAAFAVACDAVEVAYVQVFGRLLEDAVWMRQVAAGDGAHPGSDGYQSLADLVWPQWHRWLTTDAVP